MNNPTWVYFDSSCVRLYLHCDKYFKTQRVYTREDEDRKVIVQITKYKHEPVLSVQSWYWPSCRKKYKSLAGKLLFSYLVPYIDQQQYCFSIDLPESNSKWAEVHTWTELTTMNSVSNKIKSLEYTHCEKTEIVPGFYYEDQVPLTLTIEKYLHPTEAKKLWRDIKRKHLVSKFIWDDWMQDFDCYCKACKNDDGFNSWVSWVGNPDVGYVRFAKQIHKGDKVFKYRNHLLYKPCEAKEYSRLKFYNEKEYEEEVREFYKPTTVYYLTKTKYNEVAKKIGEEEWKRYGLFDLCEKINDKLLPPSFENFLDRTLPLDRSKNIPKNKVTFDWVAFDTRYPPFDNLWQIPLTDKEIEENGNSMGGAFRNISTGELIGNKDFTTEDSIAHDYEKVVSMGWHRTEIKDAVRCPVCQDLYEIICQSGWSPVPFYKMWIEKTHWKISKIKAHFKKAFDW